MITAAVFDFDGTLTPLTLDFTNLRDEIEKIVDRYDAGHLLPDLEGHFIIEMVYEIKDSLTGRGDEFFQEAFERLRALEVESAEGKALYPYTRDVLAMLKKKSIPIAIITRSCVDAVRTVFPDADAFVDTIITREHTRFVKPDPKHVLAAVAELGSHVAETIMVGDHPTDIEAGLLAGAVTAGVLTGRTYREAFERTGAHYILDDISGIPGIL